MRKYFLTLAVAFGLVSLGCDEAQLDAAQEDLAEEKAELDNLTEDVLADGTISNDEAEAIIDQNEEVGEAIGEVAEQRGDLIEAEMDD